MTPQNYLLHVLLVHLVGLYCSLNAENPLNADPQIYIDLGKYKNGYNLKSHSDNPNEPRPMTWTLTGPRRSRLEIKCSISLIKRISCSEGGLRISGIGQGLVSLCNEIPSYIRESFGNQIVVEYKTGRNKLGHFNCHVQVVRRRSFQARLPYHVGSSSRQQNQGAKKTSCPCGQTNRRRIMGGQETGVNEYPFAAYLKKNGEKYVSCGGSIITQRHILTAAHCMDRKNLQEIKVVVGGHNVISDEESVRVQKLNIGLVSYPGKRSGKLNDIAILYVSEMIVFNDYVRPVCLPTERYPLVGQMITALGWGRLAFNRQPSETLQSVELQVIDLERCAQHYKGRRIYAKDSKFLCISTELCRDTCKGDSGGPLIHWDSELNSWVQVALVTFGTFGTDGVEGPSGHTLIYAHFDWIQSVIDPNWYLRTMTAIGVPHQGTSTNNKPPYATCEKIEVLL